MEHSILEWRFLQFLIRIASLLSKRPITLLSVIVCKCWEWFSEKKYLCQIDWQERKWYSSIAVISIPFILARVLTFHLFIRSSWFVNYLFTSLTCLEGDSFFFFLSETWAYKVTTGQAPKQLLWDHQPSLLCLNPAGSDSGLQIKEQPVAQDCGGWSANRAADAECGEPRECEGAVFTLIRQPTTEPRSEGKTDAAHRFGNTPLP